MREETTLQSKTAKHGLLARTLRVAAEQNCEALRFGRRCHEIKNKKNEKKKNVKKIDKDS